MSTFLLAWEGGTSQWPQAEPVCRTSYFHNQEILEEFLQGITASLWGQYGGCRSLDQQVFVTVFVALRGVALRRGYKQDARLGRVAFFLNKVDTLSPEAMSILLLRHREVRVAVNSDINCLLLGTDYEPGSVAEIVTILLFRLGWLVISNHPGVDAVFARAEQQSAQAG